jgi:hypothetical protein
MRYMCLIVTKPPGPPEATPELVEAMNTLANREIQAGRMLGGGGLLPIDAGARVTLTADGKFTVLDGPMVEAKEVIGGYAMFEFASKEEAVASAVEFLQLHKDHQPGWEGTCEIRPMIEH